MNKVQLKGKVKFPPKSGGSAKGPEGEQGGIECGAFDDAAKALSALKQGDPVEIVGKLKRRKKKDTEVWTTEVEVLEVVGEIARERIRSDAPLFAGPEVAPEKEPG